MGSTGEVRSIVRSRLDDLITRTVNEYEAEHRRAALMATALMPDVAYSYAPQSIQDDREELRGYWLRASQAILSSHVDVVRQLAAADLGMAVAAHGLAVVSTADLLAERESLDFLFLAVNTGIGGFIWAPMSERLLAYAMGLSRKPATATGVLEDIANLFSRLGTPPWATVSGWAPDRLPTSRQLHFDDRASLRALTLTPEAWTGAAILVAIEYEQGRISPLWVRGTLEPLAVYLRRRKLRDANWELPPLPVTPDAQSLLTAWAEGILSFLTAPGRQG